MSYMYIFTPKPMGDSGGGGEGGTPLSGDQYEDYKGFILRPLVMLLITKERPSQLILSYCSLFTLNKCNMTYITLQNVTLFLISTNNYYY